MNAVMIGGFGILAVTMALIVAVAAYFAFTVVNMCGCSGDETEEEE